MAGFRCSVLRFAVLKTVRHYFVLGCYLGVFADIVILVRALPELPEKLRGVTFSILDWAIGIGGTILVLSAVVLICGLVGAMVGFYRVPPGMRLRGPPRTGG